MNQKILLSEAEKCETVLMKYTFSINLGIRQDITVHKMCL